MSQFIIADLTDPGCIPYELQAIVPTLAVPIQPILLKGKKSFAMFQDLELHDWVLPTYVYEDQTSLIEALPKYIIEPSIQKALKLERKKKKTERNS
jgi:hypothetical protein